MLLNSLLLGIDAGSNQVKVFGPDGPDIFKSNLCSWFERKVEETFGADDMEFEIDGKKGYAGSIALYEDEFGAASIYGESKANNDTKIRVLLAIHRYISKHRPNVSSVAIVVGQPIRGHKDVEKNKIKEMLLDTHTVTVNKQTLTFSITEVGVAAEGSAAYLNRREKGIVRVIDLGGGTCNAATIIDGKFINSASDTFIFGADTVNNKNGIAQGIVRNTSKLKWQRSDTVYLCGGMAESLTTGIKHHYANATTLYPTFKQGNEILVYGPIYANAIAFYTIAKGTFK